MATESKVVELDVREDLKNKVEPFQKIMGAVDSLNENDVFVLHTPFIPEPLLKVMKNKGYSNEVATEVENVHYITTFKREL
ncbi:DUF2249 domain-containing protein [Anaerobacillus sp. MEB173]|uniref:DUF2249 domain-containing protein n=1 Tax=Anaerobacillus sp. MEB173 TaxID=3383345 RepID=UPI003F8E26CD